MAPQKTVVTKSARARIAQLLALRAMYPDITNTEIAARMGIKATSLNTLIWRSTKEGLIQFDDPMDKLEYEIIPKVVDNLKAYLDSADDGARLKTTLETAKGTIFRQYQEVKGVNQNPQTVLALKIEMPDGDSIKLAAGQIVGKPKVLQE